MPVGQGPPDELHMPSEPLTFTELDRRIAALPEGPAAELNPPRWQPWLDAVGLAGIVLGLLPSLLVEFWTPQDWMAWMASAGLGLTALFLPGFARSMFLMVRGMRQWRLQLVAQLDHDVASMATLQTWLARQPREAIESHLWFVRHAHARLGHKMGFLFGGIDKAGVLVVVGAVSVQIKAFVDGAVPWWLAMVTIFVAVTYAVGIMASLMRLRMQLYEALLDDALRRRG